MVNILKADGKEAQGDNIILMTIIFIMLFITTYADFTMLVSCS